MIDGSAMGGAEGANVRRAECTGSSCPEGIVWTPYDAADETSLTN